VLRNYGFTLSETDEAHLRANVYQIQRSLCGLELTYGFAYPKYETATSSSAERAALPAKA